MKDKNTKEQASPVIATVVGIMIAIWIVGMVIIIYDLILNPLLGDL